MPNSKLKLKKSKLKKKLLKKKLLINYLSGKETKSILKQPFWLTKTPKLQNILFKIQQFST